MNNEDLQFVCNKLVKFWYLPHSIEQALHNQYAHLYQDVL
jgi:hypothetical protein